MLVTETVVLYRSFSLPGFCGEWLIFPDTVMSDWRRNRVRVIQRRG